MGTNMKNNQTNLTFCNPSQLSVLSYANHFTLWHYKTTRHTIQMPQYFDNVADILRENDMIIATTNFDEAPQTGFYTVLARTKDHVVVTPLNYGNDPQEDGFECAAVMRKSIAAASFTEAPCVSLPPH